MLCQTAVGMRNVVGSLDDRGTAFFGLFNEGADRLFIAAVGINPFYVISAEIIGTNEHLRKLLVCAKGALLGECVSQCLFARVIDDGSVKRDLLAILKLFGTNADNFVFALQGFFLLENDVAGFIKVLLIGRRGDYFKIIILIESIFFFQALIKGFEC